MGPVGLREKRLEPQKITVPVPEVGEQTIQKNWLKVHGEKDERLYHHCIKQSMLLAARTMDLNDATDPMSTRDDADQIRARMNIIQSGQEKIQIAGHKKSLIKNIQKKDERERHLMVKHSKRCCCDRRERSFIIENGEIVVYKSKHKNAKISFPSYKMKDASLNVETRMQGTLQRPRFEEGYTDRMKVTFPERQNQNKNPFYLYPQSKEQLLNWKRAFQLARVLVSDNDRRVLKVSVGRCTSISLIKGWEALIFYFKEIAETRKLVRQMALRLMKVDFSRGWTKMKLVNKQIVEKRAKRVEQQLWAARFMSEKLTRLGTSKCQKLSEVREKHITRIQQKFRIYRDEKIFDRQYPIGSKIVSRMRQARQGCQMDVALDVLSCDEVLKMSLTDHRSLERYIVSPEQLSTKKSTYSEVNIPAAEMLLSVSDNLQSLAFTAPTHTADAWSHLSKSDWSNFVNLDRLSQVVLHTAPHIAIKRKDAQEQGVWCTIYGPKISRGKRIDVVETKDGKQVSCEVVGTPDGFAVPKALGQKFDDCRRKATNAGRPGTGIKWVEISVGPEFQASWDLEDTKPGADPAAPKEQKKTFIHIHVLGYRFTSEVCTGDGKTYTFKPPGVRKAMVPIADDDGAMVALDNSELGVEVLEQVTSQKSAGQPFVIENKQLLAGRENLWTIFNPKPNARMESYKKRLEVPDAPPGSYPLLLAPPEIQEGAKAMGRIVIPLDVKIGDDFQQRDAFCVSPELVGAGILTSLYTSHRGAWHDQELGPGQFRLDHVSNFVELVLSGFRFPNSDVQADLAAGRMPPSYRIRASLAGITTETPSLHRAPMGAAGEPSKWAWVLGTQLADPFIIKFNGCRLCLPLPPGCWGSYAEGKRPIIELEVIKGEHEQFTPMNYETFSKSQGSQQRTQPQEEVVYRTSISFDSILVDQVKQVSAFFASGKKPTDDVICDVFTNMVKKGKPTEAVLNIDFSLRDRDYIKSTVGHPPGDQKTICVGDNALLVVEEPLMYPESANEARRRFSQSGYKKESKDWPKVKGSVPGQEPRARGAALRDPCLSSEYAASELEHMTPKVPFKQSVIPNYCTDIIPHKYVLPLSEQQFRTEMRPGLWPLILDDLATTRRLENVKVTRVVPQKIIVTHLSHATRKIPVTLLATYPDGTADVEVAASFMEEWKESHPERKYALPGLLQQAPTPRPQGEGPITKTPPIRCILKKVAIRSLAAVHSASFHVFDAKYKDTKDYMAEAPAHRGFNPREKEENQDQAGFSIGAGPLPSDCSPACCQYEWSLHVRAPTETEMHKFVAMLRQCVRVDHHQHSMKMVAYQSKPADTVMPAQMQRAYVGGQLEVVLVEARRLEAKGVTKQVESLKKTLATPFGMEYHLGPLDDTKMQALQGTTAGEASKSTPMGQDNSTFVSFRMKHGDEVLAFKSAKVQHSPIIRGTDSPCWASLPELVNSGGWTFKTGLIDPEKLQDLVIEFEVNQFSVGMSTIIGAIQLGVTQRPYLTNPKEPFRNLWLPLLSAKNGKVTPNETGEIHVLTRWLPADKLYLPPGQQQVSVRSHFLKELWPKVCALRVKEPLYSVEAQYLMNYNPNLVRTKIAELPSDHTRRHTEDLASTVPYLECLERRQSKLWEAFDNQLTQENLKHIRMGELRLKWIHEEDSSHLEKIQSLIEGGIPSSRREQVWLDLTMASRVLELDGLGGQRRESADPEAARKAAEQDYQRQLELGLPQRSDANQQLQEDAFHLAAWESTTPPVAELLDFHLRRLRRAQNVCTALIAYDKSGVAYCESLLIVSFFLLLPQGFKEEGNEEGGTVMHYMSESSAFWLLYTLVGTRVNGTFKEYYGRPEPVPQTDGSQPQESLCVTSGAMHDVALLECCLAYHEHDLWAFLTRIGFQMACIFYGAFMRLFATYMPTATVFRFWDILFSQSSDPKAQPSGRAYLIDLAFAMLKSKKESIMACESALEVRNLILGCFGSLYDTSTAVELATNAHQYLWGHLGFSFGKVGHLWTQREDLFKGVNETITEQNQVLRVLTHERALGSIPQTKYTSQPNTKGVTTKELLKDVLPVMQQAFENLRSRSTGSGRHWAMHRPMPLAAKALSENMLEKAFNLANITFRGAHLHPIPVMVGPADAAERGNKGCPGLEPLDITSGDMATVLQKDIPNWSNLHQHLWRTFTNREDTYKHAQHGMPHHEGGHNLANEGPAIVKWLFGNPQQEAWKRQQQANHGIEERVSLNELFIALICCSRGTLGDKAAALFNIYSYVVPLQSQGIYHWQPIARLAKSITKTGDGSGEHMGKNLTAPDPDSVSKETVLHFQVYSNYPKKGTLVGEVFVSSLGPFIGYNPNDAEVLPYNIWGPSQTSINTRQASSKNLTTGPSSNITHSQSASAVGDGEKVVVGEMYMALTWTPKTIKQPEVGQLCIRLKGIRFFKMYVSDYFKMNPRVTVHTYNPKSIKANNPQGITKIDRWDPRGMMNTDAHHSWLTTSGAYGGQMDFEPTMKESMIGHGEHFKHYWRHGADMGFNPESEEWCWNETWGKQFSVESVTMQKEFMGLSQRKNVMGMHGVRHIVAGILHRSMLNVTNRQALLIADTLFNRQGAVPGILEAWLVSGTSTPKEGGLDQFGKKSNVGPYWPELSVKQLKDKWAKERALKGPVDVTNAIMVEHERQVQAFGFMNLFHESFMKQHAGLGLTAMGITDPFPGMQKTLWIRYVRGGDGERCTQGVVIDRSGKILHGIVGPGATEAEQPPPEIKFDLQDCFPQNAVTKEEFISCILNSPLLGESLRRIGATDHVFHPKKAIPLDVTVMDPHQEEEDQQFMDAVNVGQSILVEVWDADVGSKDFLGEAWLPPLSSLSMPPKDFVLPLREADMSEDAENGPSRENKHKELGVGDDKKITGELYVRLGWQYPVYGPDGKPTVAAAGGDNATDAESIKNRAQIQEQLHTGRLVFKVLRAQHLRRADAAKGRNCDPQVTAYVRNDMVQVDGQLRPQWRKKPLARTGIVRNNRNPKWENEFKEPHFDIMTGSYEARFPPKQDGWFEEMKTVFRTNKAKRHIREDREISALKRHGASGLKMKFLETLPPDNAPPTASQGSSQDGGDNHRVEIFLGDTIREFKSKMSQACDLEAAFWLNRGEANKESRFRDVRIGYKHLVMVFVPSPKVQKLYAQKLHEGQEYKHAYNQAIQDPSNWQPLDPTRTFGQYPQYGFGRKQAQLLRIVEATEGYKLVNLRYKEFEREQSKMSYQDRNDADECYGYAKYWHVFDTGVPRAPPPVAGAPAPAAPSLPPTRDWEWRPAMISKGSGGGVDGAPLKYKVNWVFQPLTKDSDILPKTQLDQNGRHEMRKEDVLLAPRCPKVDAYVHPDHAELLEQARTFRQIGKSDWEIEVMLNKSLDDTWANAHKEPGTQDIGSKPPRITVDIIRNFLQRVDTLAASQSGGAASSKQALNSSESGASPANNGKGPAGGARPASPASNTRPPTRP